MKTRRYFARPDGPAPLSGDEAVDALLLPDGRDLGRNRGDHLGHQPRDPPVANDRLTHPGPHHAPMIHAKGIARQSQPGTRSLADFDETSGADRSDTSDASR
jgi:hypothetical protein